jgi:O-antigen ligase
MRAGATLAIVVAGLAFSYHEFMPRDSRLADTGQEIANFRDKNVVTSAGVRLEFYRRSIELFEHRPVAGYGVGSVLSEFERLVKNETGGRATALGIVGIALFVWLLVALYRECRRVDPLSRTLVYGYLIAFTVGCLANSLLLNFTEGCFFVLLSGIVMYTGRALGGSTAPLRESP